MLILMMRRRRKEDTNYDDADIDVKGIDDIARVIFSPLRL
jgi:hypothetical protein